MDFEGEMHMHEGGIDKNKRNGWLKYLVWIFFREKGCY